MSKEKKSIVVIGAGMTGLPIGLEFCKKGFKVKILEKNPFVGGIATSILDRGYAMDIGPHYVTLPENSEITETVQSMIGKENLEKLPGDIRRSRKAYFQGRMWNEFPTINQFLSNLRRIEQLKIIVEITINKIKKRRELRDP